MEYKEFGNMMDNAIKAVVLKSMENDPVFKEKMVELINKKDDTDKNIDVHIGLPALKVDDNKMSYVIATGKRRNEWSFTSLQSMSLSKNLLKDLYKQLGEILKEESK